MSDKKIKSDVKKEVKKEERKEGIVKKAGKDPKVRGLLTPQQMSKYLAAILDPITNGYGVKIPDTITTASFPFQAVTRFSVTPVQDGATGVYVMVVMGIFGSANGSNSSIWTLATFNSSTNTVTWTQLPIATRTWRAQMIANASVSRLVSGVATLQGQSNY
jgi:hypothetical protein